MREVLSLGKNLELVLEIYRKFYKTRDGTITPILGVQLKA